MSRLLSVKEGFEILVETERIRKKIISVRQRALLGLAKTLLASKTPDLKAFEALMCETVRQHFQSTNESHWMEAENLHCVNDANRNLVLVEDRL